MFARIGVWQGSEEELRRWIARSRDEVKPAVKAQAGTVGAYWLLDRGSRKALTITLWETEDAMRASDALAARVQAGTSAVSGARFTTERFEIVDHF